MADLITLAEYKESEKITKTDEDARLSALIASASKLIKTYCGHSFVDYYTNPVVEKFNLDYRTTFIQLNEWPIVAIVSVEVRDSPSDSYRTLVADTDFYVDENTDSLIKLGTDFGFYWPEGPGGVKVTYRAGYAEVPEDLKLAVIDLVTYYHKDEHKKTRTLMGSQMQNADKVAVNSNKLPDHISRILDMYKG